MNSGNKAGEIVNFEWVYWKLDYFDMQYRSKNYSENKTEQSERVHN